MSQIVIKDRVRHEEWKEAEFTPEQFRQFFEASEKEDYSMYPTFEFEHGTEYTDESWSINPDNTISTSSYQMGIIDHDGSTHIKQYYGSTKDLGKLVCVKLRLDEEDLEVIQMLEDEIF